MGSLPCLVPSHSPTENVVQCGIRLINVGFQKSGHEAVETTPIPSSFSNPMKLHVHWTCAHSTSFQPQHFTSEKEHHCGERQKWEEYHPSIQSVCWIHSNPVRADQRYLSGCQVFLKMSKNTLPKGPKCFDLKNTIIISQQEVHVLLYRSKYSVSGQGSLSTVYDTVLQSGPCNKST